jgi:hypothetical protein
MICHRFFGPTINTESADEAYKIGWLRNTTSIYADRGFLELNTPQEGLLLPKG